jgi:serine/threonine protein kinase
MLGAFQVLAPIGRGGMGTVYLARDSRNQQLVALKVLSAKRAKQEDRLLARFRREMEMCQRVAHPHLVWTHEVGVYHGVYFIAMEFIPGKSLHRLVSEQGPLTVARAAHLFTEAASGLEHAHEQGLIHRDLKPSNIMVTPNDHAKVLDLGLALMQGEEPVDCKAVGGQSYVVGTMDYIAPEQTENASRVDARSDVYALGCTLYYALTGRPPFPGGSTRDKVRCHRSMPPPPLTHLNAAVPSAFAAVVDKMMAKQPEQRFPSAAAVRQALRPWAPVELLPLDRQGDLNYQQAVAELEAADASDLMGDLVIIEKTPPSGQKDRLADAAWSSPSADAGAAPQGGREIFWLCVGLLGFWAVLLGSLGIVLLLR